MISPNTIADAELDTLQALHFSEPGYGRPRPGCVWCHECNLQYPCPTLAALSTPPEATE